jgi:hypothetical protein
MKIWDWPEQDRDQKNGGYKPPYKRWPNGHLTEKSSHFLVPAARKSRTACIQVPTFINRSYPSLNMLYHITKYLSIVETTYLSLFLVRSG